MKRPLLIITLTMALSTPVWASQGGMSFQVKEALNSWFNRKTLIAGTALISSAVLSVMVYKALRKLNQSFAHWLTGKIVPPEEKFPNVEVTERTPEEMEHMSAQEINELISRPHESSFPQIPQNTYENIENARIKLRQNDPRYILESNNWNKNTIKELRENPRYQDTDGKEMLDRILARHYGQKIYNILQTVPLDERGKWIKDASDLLTLKPNTIIPNIIESTSDGSERGSQGTKYKALQEIQKYNIPERTDRLPISPQKFLEDL